MTALENLDEGKLTVDVVRERLLAEESKKTDRLVDVGSEKPAAFIGTKQKPKRLQVNVIDFIRKGVWPEFVESSYLLKLILQAVDKELLS